MKPFAHYLYRVVQKDRKDSKLIIQSSKYSSFLACLNILILLNCSSSEHSDNPYEPEIPSTIISQLQTLNNQIIDENAQAVMLRGINRSGLEFDKSGAGINRDELHHFIDEWGAGIMRIPFNQNWILSDQGYNILLDQIIQWIIEKNVYVLL